MPDDEVVGVEAAAAAWSCTVAVISLSSSFMRCDCAARSSSRSFSFCSSIARRYDMASLGFEPSAARGTPPSTRAESLPADTERRNATRLGRAFGSSSVVLTGGVAVVPLLRTTAAAGRAVVATVEGVGPRARSAVVVVVGVVVAAGAVGLRVGIDERLALARPAGATVVDEAGVLEAARRAAAVPVVGLVS